MPHRRCPPECLLRWPTSPAPLPPWALQTTCSSAPVFRNCQNKTQALSQTPGMRSPPALLPPLSPSLPSLFSPSSSRPPFLFLLFTIHCLLFSLGLNHPSSLYRINGTTYEPTERAAA